MCLLIYLFGDARQLYPYELARPSFESLSSSMRDDKTLSPNTYTSPTSPTAPWTSDSDATKVPISPGSSIKKGKDDLEAGPEGDVYVSPTFPIASPSAAFHSTRTAQSSQGSVTDIAAPFDTSEVPQNPLRSAAGIYFPNGSTDQVDRSWKSSFNIRNLAKSRKPNADTFAPVKATPMFGSLTEVESPVITRAQWEIAARAMGYSVFITIALGAAILAIPARGYHYH
jgi:hypothetical protein